MAELLGKLLIVAGLGFQAYDLYTSEDTSNKFSSNFEKALRKGTHYGVDLNSFIAGKAEIVKLVVVALYALSALILLTRSKFIRFLVILGVIVNSLIMTNPIVDRTEGIVILLFQNIAIIGGLFYSMSQSLTPAPVSSSPPSKTATTTKQPDAPKSNRNQKKRA